MLREFAEERRQLGQQFRQHMLERHGVKAGIERIDAIYEKLLTEQGRR